MSSTINATTVGVGGVVTTADNSGILILQTASTTALTISAAQGVTLASTLGVTGATTLSTTLGVTGAATLSSTLAVTGITTVAAGSAAAPSIVSTTGTADTGQFFPAADTVAFSTAGTERMRIDSTGLVGIGTTSPSSFNSNAYDLVVGSGSGAKGLTIYTGTTSYGSIHFADGTAGADLYRGIIRYLHTDNSMEFYTDATQRMTISSAGVVSVTGSATISSTLAVAGITTVAAGTAALPSIISTTGTADTGQWFPAADTIAWSTAGSERARITSGGLFGIGVTPGAALHVFGNNGSFGFNSFFGLNGSTSGIGIGNNATIGLIQGATTATSGVAADIAMQSSGGSLLVGSTSTSNTSGTGIKLIPTEGGNSGRATLSIVTVESTSATSGFRLYSTGAAAYRFYIDNDGKPYSTLPLGTISDARLKTNIKNISYGLEDLLKIRPVNFDWKDGSDTNRVGFIAQELKTIISQAVTDTKNIAEDETPYMAVTESNLIPVMVKAIQELKAIIDTQAARITALETL